MEQSAREKFYERIETAPLAARGFFESVDEHFRPRNDVTVTYTQTGSTDMRLWAHWATLPVMKERISLARGLGVYGNRLCSCGVSYRPKK